MSNTYIMIAGHGDGDPGARGYIQKGEHRYMKEDLFPAMKKYIPDGVKVVWIDNQNVYARNTLVSIARKYKNPVIIEWHYDAFRGTQSGGHVIVYGGFKADKIDLGIRDAIRKNVGLVYSHMGDAGISGRSDLANPNRAANAGINYRLVELGFGDHPKDAKVMTEQIDRYAKDLVQGIFGKVRSNAVQKAGITNIKPVDKKFKLLPHATAYATGERVSDQVKGHVFKATKVGDIKKSKSNKAYVLHDGKYPIGWVLEQDLEEISDELYRVQVGAYRDVKNAEAKAKELKAQGHDTMIVKNVGK